MMDKQTIKKQVLSLVDLADGRKQDTNLIIIATIADESAKYSNYHIHSVATSYLSRKELDELVNSFRRYCNYLEIYTDIEDFLRDYYANGLHIKPTLIFETSAKGIGRGRDALIPALCDIWGYPHIGAEATSNVLCSCKYQWTSIMKGNGITVPESYLYINGHWVVEPPIGQKYILKLNNECASIGLSSDSVMSNDGVNVTHKAERLQADYKQPVIAQKFIEGYEVEVPVLVNHQFRVVLPPVGLEAESGKYYKNEFFDYDSIFFDDYTTYDFSEYRPQAAEQLSRCAYKIIDLLDMTGYMRIDFRVGADGTCYVIDINNDPCINSCGSFFKSLEILGVDSQDIAGVIIGNKLI